MTDAPSSSNGPRFGTAPPGVTLHARGAAYAVIRGTGGRVAAIHVPQALPTTPRAPRPNEGARYWLPGGSIEPGESAETAVQREVLEELGRTIRLIGPLGEAVQVFYASDDERWHEMTATFFGAEFDGRPPRRGEHDLCWLDPTTQRDAFFHACHAWAASLAAGDTPVLVC